MREPLRRRSFLALGLALVVLVVGSLVTWWSRRSTPRRSPHRRAPAPVHRPEDLRGSLRALFVALGPFAPRDVPDWIERFVSPARLERYRSAAPDLAVLATRLSSDRPLRSVDLSTMTAPQREVLSTLIADIYGSPIGDFVADEVPAGQCVGPVRYTLAPPTSS